MRNGTIKKIGILGLSIALLSFIGCTKKENSLKSGNSTEVVSTKKSSDIIVNKGKLEGDKNSNKEKSTGQILKDLEEVSNFDALKSSDESIEEILKKLKSMNQGVGPWNIIFASDQKVVFYNYSHLLVYDNSEGKKGICSVIDLGKFEKGNIQGSNMAEFYASPNGNYIILSTGDTDESKKTKMYFCDLTNNKALMISEENYFSITDAWSDSSLFYAFADRDGKRVLVYDVIKNKLTKIPFNKGLVNGIFVSNKGDIIVNSNKKYTLNKNDKYKISEMAIQGKLLDIKEDKVIYYDSGSIYAYDSGKTASILNLGREYKLVKHNDNKAVFSNEVKTKVYSYNSEEIYDYNIKFEKIEYSYFSPDARRCIILDERHKLQVIDSEGKIYETLKSDFSGYVGDFKWINNSSLVKVSYINSQGSALGDFKIEKYDLDTEKSLVLYKN